MSTQAKSVLVLHVSHSNKSSLYNYNNPLSTNARVELLHRGHRLFGSGKIEKQISSVSYREISCFYGMFSGTSTNPKHIALSLSLSSLII